MIDIPKILSASTIKSRIDLFLPTVLRRSFFIDGVLVGKICRIYMANIRNLGQWIRNLRDFRIVSPSIKRQKPLGIATHLTLHFASMIDSQWVPPVYLRSEAHCRSGFRSLRTPRRQPISFPPLLFERSARRNQTLSDLAAVRSEDTREGRSNLFLSEKVVYKSIQLN